MVHDRLDSVEVRGRDLSISQVVMMVVMVMMVVVMMMFMVMVGMSIPL